MKLIKLVKIVNSEETLQCRSMYSDDGSSIKNVSSNRLSVLLDREEQSAVNEDTVEYKQVLRDILKTCDKTKRKSSLQKRIKAYAQGKSGICHEDFNVDWFAKPLFDVVTDHEDVFDVETVMQSFITVGGAYAEGGVLDGIAALNTLCFDDRIRLLLAIKCCIVVLNCSDMREEDAQVFQYVLDSLRLFFVLIQIVPSEEAVAKSRVMK